MTGIDYLLLAVVGLSVLFALLRRATLNLITLLGWSVALVLAFRYFQSVAEKLLPWSLTNLTAEAVSFSALFLGVLAVFNLMGWIFSSWATEVELSLSGQLFALLIGFWRGSLLVILATGATFYFAVPTSQMASRSLLLPHAVQGMEWMADKMPEGSELAAYLVQKRLEFP
jgi:membrane protein required for colicin V production